MSDIVLDDCIKCGPNPPRTIGSREFFSGTPTEPKHIVDSAECIQRQLDQKDAEIRVLERALAMAVYDKHWAVRNWNKCRADYDGWDIEGTAFFPQSASVEMYKEQARKEVSE